MQRRTKLKLITLFCVLAAVLTVLIAFLTGNDRRYYLLSILVIVFATVPLIYSFEKRRPSAGEIVLLAVFATVAAVGRILFATTSHIKPMAAIVILAGMCFGGQSGFLVGAVSLFVSNFYFMHGVWTPWQMFGFGLVGLAAALLPRIGIKPQRPILTAIGGAVITFVVYGGFINFADPLMYGGEFSIPILLGKYATAFGVDLTHAISTGIFLLLLSKPVSKRVERIKIKYGLFEER